MESVSNLKACTSQRYSPYNPSNSQVTLFLLKSISLQASFETQILNSLITVRQGQTASILSSVNVTTLFLS